MSTQGSFVWYELWTRDPPGALSRYARVLGWRRESMTLAGDEYPMLAHEGVLQVGVLPSDGSKPVHRGWLGYMQVDDVDASAGRVARLGGAIVQPPYDLPEVGASAIVRDPHGAAFGLFRPRDPAPASTCVHWHELLSPQPEASLRFYCEAFGYRGQTMQMPDGPYHVLANEAGGHGGIMAVASGLTPGWVPYLRVGGCDRVTSELAAEGMRAAVGPLDLEGIGRVAVMVDGGGEQVGVIEPTG